MFAWPCWNVTIEFVVTCPCGKKVTTGPHTIGSRYAEVPAPNLPHGWTTHNDTAWCPGHVFTNRAVS